MEQLLEQADLYGKTIERIANEGEQIWIFFTDNSFSVIVNEGYDDTDLNIDTDQHSIIPTKYNYRTLFRVGIITKDEYDTFERESMGIEKKRQLKQRKEQYEKLKKEFN